jgi:hypothetical protein
VGRCFLICIISFDILQFSHLHGALHLKHCPVTDHAERGRAVAALLLRQSASRRPCAAFQHLGPRKAFGCES